MTLCFQSWKPLFMRSVFLDTNSAAILSNGRALMLFVIFCCNFTANITTAAYVIESVWSISYKIGRVFLYSLPVFG